MCMMSVVTGYGMGVQQNHWTPVTWKMFQDLVARVDKLDSALGEHECIDPAKDEWLKKMSDMYDEIKSPTPVNLINLFKANKHD